MYSLRAPASSLGSHHYPVCHSHRVGTCLRDVSGLSCSWNLFLCLPLDHSIGTFCASRFISVFDFLSMILWAVLRVIAGLACLPPRPSRGMGRQTPSLLCCLHEPHRTLPLDHTWHTKEPRSRCCHCCWTVSHHVKRFRGEASLCSPCSMFPRLHMGHGPHRLNISMGGGGRGCLVVLSVLRGHPLSPRPGPLVMCLGFSGCFQHVV